MIRKHWGVFLIALIAGSIVSFPQVIAEHRMGSLYQGVHPVVSDDELYYLARAHETLDGHPLLGNPYLYEHKSDPGVQIWLPDTVLTRISMALFGDIHRGIIFWDFVLPALAVLLSYAILFLLTESVTLSLGISALLNLDLYFVQLNRTPIPQLFVLMLLSVYLLLRATERRDTKWVVAAMLGGGALFYVYPFYWTYWVVLVGLACVGSFMFIRETGVYKTYAAIVGGALILGIPYFVGQYQATKLPYYLESLWHMGVIQTHFPSGFVDVGCALVALALIAFGWYKRIVPQSAETILIASASLAGIVVLNQQMIVGIEDLSTLHYDMTATYMTVFAFAFFAVYALKQYKLSHTKIILRCASAVLIAGALLQIAPSVLRIATPDPATIQTERYGPILQWLDDNTHTDDVVYADETLSPYIPVYTRDNVFFSNWIYMTYMPQAEIEARYVGERYFDGQLSLPTLHAADQELFGDHFVAGFQHMETINKIRKLFRLAPLSVERYPDAELQTMITAENTLQKKGSFISALAGYRVDYIVWDTVAEPNWHLPQYLKKVYEANGIDIYSMPKN